MLNFFNNTLAYQLFQSKELILLTTSISLIILCILGVMLFRKMVDFSPNTIFQKHKSAFAYIFLIIIGYGIENISWIVYTINRLGVYSFSNNTVNYIIDVAWCFTILRYIAISLFINYLIKKTNKLDLAHVFFISIATCLVVLQMYIMYLYAIQSSFEDLIKRISCLSVFTLEALILVYAFYQCLEVFKNKELPFFLKRQLQTLFHYFLIPICIVEGMQYSSALYSAFIVPEHFQTFVSISTTLITCSIIYCLRQLLNFRLFNVQTSIISNEKIALVKELHHAAYAMNKVENEYKVIALAQQFIHTLTGAPLTSIDGHVRAKNPQTGPIKTVCASPIKVAIEHLITSDEHVAWLQKRHILVADEIAFDAYYAPEDQELAFLHTFLTKLNCSVVLPLFSSTDEVMGYVYIEKNTPEHYLYTTNMQIQMCLLAQYAGNALFNLRQNDYFALKAAYKALDEQLHHDHNEQAASAEALDKIMKQKLEGKIGILFYYKGALIFGNTTAAEMLPVNPNTHPGHPIIQALLKIGSAVSNYRAQQEQIITEIQDNPLYAYAIPNAEPVGAIIVLHQPDVGDIIKYLTKAVSSNNSYDQLLRLYGTQAGAIINKVIPGQTPTLLKFKLNLLQASYSKKAVLIDAPEQDIDTIADIVHRISLRSKMHTVIVASSKEQTDRTKEFFGVNNLLYDHVAHPILEEFKDGTLFIKHIDRLTLETQDKLADFLKYGIYTPVKSNTRHTSSARVLCTISNDIDLLLENKLLSQKLYEQLQPTILELPSLLDLSETEAKDLMDNIAFNYVEYNNHTQVQHLSEQEKEIILRQCPASLVELQSCVRVVVGKRKNGPQTEYSEELFLPAHLTTALEDGDPEILRAIKLGKHALKDKKLMAYLWAKFKSQSKIAECLQVNRSSVNRRCKEYNLID